MSVQNYGISGAFDSSFLISISLLNITEPWKKEGEKKKQGGWENGWIFI